MALIHLVDDDLAVTDASRFLLEGLDYRVKIWNDSQSFIDQVDPYQCGVVMLDIRMPGIDGQQIHQRLRERESTLAVVIVTGHGGSRDEIGGVGFPAKADCHRTADRRVRTGDRPFSTPSGALPVAAALQYANLTRA